jgi:hypothetical protein
MAIITPNNVVPNASLGSPLITPGWPLAVVLMASPVAAVLLKVPTDGVTTPMLSPTMATVLHQSGHDADRTT